MAYQLEIQHLGGKYFVWFSKELNPIANGNSSNPLELYLEIDRAVKKSDVNHAKLKDLKANLLWVVNTFIAPSDSKRARLLTAQILRAQVEMYRPQIWKLDLSKVQSTRWNKTGANPAWDEQFVTDLRNGEFEIIVD